MKSDGAPSMLLSCSCLILLLFCVWLIAGCASTANAETAVAGVPGGDPARGKQAFVNYGCGACHTIDGLPRARGLVGPPLTNIGSRAYIAGMLSNTPPNLMAWIMHPQQIVPGNAMPELDVSEQDARDITAYLYTLRNRE